MSWPHVNQTPLNGFCTEGYVYGVSTLSHRLVVLIANTHLHDQTWCFIVIIVCTYMHIHVVYLTYTLLIKVPQTSQLHA